MTRAIIEGIPLSILVRYIQLLASALDHCSAKEGHTIQGDADEAHFTFQIERVILGEENRMLRNCISSLVSFLCLGSTTIAFSTSIFLL
jgi:hypothetical protein